MMGRIFPGQPVEDVSYTIDVIDEFTYHIL